MVGLQCYSPSRRQERSSQIVSYLRLNGYLPPAYEVAGRQCFLKRLSICSQRGGDPTPTDLVPPPPLRTTKAGGTHPIGMLSGQEWNGSAVGFVNSTVNWNFEKENEELPFIKAKLMWPSQKVCLSLYSNTGFSFFSCSYLLFSLTKIMTKYVFIILIMLPNGVLPMLG